MTTVPAKPRNIKLTQRSPEARSVRALRHICWCGSAKAGLNRWRLIPLRPGPAPMASASGNHGLIDNAPTAQLAQVSVPGLFLSSQN
jgi:hypothetical protein